MKHFVARVQRQPGVYCITLSVAAESHVENLLLMCDGGRLMVWDWTRMWGMPNIHTQDQTSAAGN